MERRILLAFVLSFFVFVVWVRIFPPPPPPEPVEAPSERANVQPEDIVTTRDEEPGENLVDAKDQGPTPELEDTAPGDAGTPSTDPNWPKREGASIRDIVIETPLLTATLSTEGVRLSSLLLFDYQDQNGDPYEIVAVGPSEASDNFPLDLAAGTEEDTRRLRGAIYEVSRPSLRLRPGEHGEISFSWADGQGLEVERSFEFNADEYRFRVMASVKRQGREIAKTVWMGPGVGAEASTSRYVGVDKAVFVRGGRPELFDAGDLEDAPVDPGGATAVGVSSHYFASLILPMEVRPETSRFVKMSWSDDEEGKKRDLISAAVGFSDEPAAFEVFMGPKKVEVLDALGPGVGAIVEFGDWLKVVAVPLRRALMWAHGVVGNYGWAIVVLTLLINVALAPFKHYSYVSMRKMQKLAPQTKKIQERYKKLKPTDPKRQEMNEEMMALYKKHKVSPLSGCLPMLITIPFFFAFYRLLMASIELRQAPFLGWIQDLSVHDPFFVLPILMGVTQFGMHKLTPNTSADPTQAKIMGMMPLFITFMLAWAPAGLVLYWFTNNLVSMTQQIATNRLLQKRDETQPTEEKAGKRKKRSKSVEQVG